MRKISVFTGAMVIAVIVGCNREQGKASSSPAPAAVEQPKREAVNAKIFEPVYRAAKSVQGATESGVSYVKFGELLQAFSTEISIAKDQTLNVTDKQLLTLYEEALGHYQVSAMLWRQKIQSSEEHWKGEIPVKFNGKLDPTIQRIIETYNLPLADRRMQYTNTKYGAIPGDSPQRVWAKAQETLQKATDLYYGR